MSLLDDHIQKIDLPPAILNEDSTVYDDAGDLKLRDIVLNQELEIAE